MSSRSASAIAGLAVLILTAVDSFRTSSPCRGVVRPSPARLTVGPQSLTTTTTRGESLSGDRRVGLTRLGARGGMDAYDAQMAALRSSAAAPSGGDVETNEDDLAAAAPGGDYSPGGPASASHWSGQNSYMTHLSPSSSNGYKAPSYGRFPSSKGHSGDGQSSSDSSGESLSAENAMSYQSYLQRLQSDMDTERAECESVNNADGDGLDVDKVASQMLDSTRKAVAAESTTNIAAAFRAPAEEKAPPTEDEMLAMISNEVAYSKFRGRNPNSLLDLEFDVLRQRVLDNIEDATQKNNGKSKGKSYLSMKDVPREERKTVVVLGTGWGSHAFVKLASTYDLRIVVVSPVNHFVFTPS